MSKLTSSRSRAAVSPKTPQRGPRQHDLALEHWRMAIDADGVAWLTLDRAGRSANTLSEAVMREFESLLTQVLAREPKAIVLASAKPGGFAAGADIHDFQGITDAEPIAARMRDAHRILDRFAALKIPTIAVIHGHCLGGGLELALACRYRIATPDAKLGFPEVLLGLHPGLGGTFRSPARIGPVPAMTLMLTGKAAHAAKAKRLRLVDAVVEERHIAAAVSAAVAGKMPRKARPWYSRLLELVPVRRMIAKRMRAQTEAQAPSAQYPAPYRLIDLWETCGGERSAMQEGEIDSFAHLLAGETAQQLVRVYFLREALRAQGKGESQIRQVHVIGAGTMGAEIAAWCAARGLRVSLTDRDPAALAKAIGRAQAYFRRGLHSSIGRRDAADRLIPDWQGEAVPHADLVIEAIAEDVELKRKVYREVLPRMKRQAILATNTSSLPLDVLCADLPVAERFVGIHFFNPVTRMMLVEVVSHPQVAAEVLARARAFCGDIDRLPVPVRSAPGFLVNRVLTSYLAEAFLLVDAGEKPEAIDQAAKSFGMPMGPLELADRVGLDVGLAVANSLRQAFPDEVAEVPQWLQRKVERGELGRKTGKGVYDYDKSGKPKRAKVEAVPAELTDRLILPMLNTSVRLLREGVVEEADMIDAAMIFGTGFAPFRGGPLQYARDRGVNDVVTTLQRLEAELGRRFAPDAGWQSWS